MWKLYSILFDVLIILHNKLPVNDCHWNIYQRFCFQWKRFSSFLKLTIRNVQYFRQKTKMNSGYNFSVYDDDDELYGDRPKEKTQYFLRPIIYNINKCQQQSRIGKHNSFWLDHCWCIWMMNASMSIHIHTHGTSH